MIQFENGTGQQSVRLVRHLERQALFRVVRGIAKASDYERLTESIRVPSSWRGIFRRAAGFALRAEQRTHSREAVALAEQARRLERDAIDALIAGCARGLDFNTLARAAWVPPDFAEMFEAAAIARETAEIEECEAGERAQQAIDGWVSAIERARVAR